MQIDPTSPASGAAFGQNEAATTTGTKTLGQNDFLKLLTVQMQSQDPLHPMEDTAFISQMANFTSLEQMKKLSASFDAFSSQQRSVSAQTYLGKTVTLLDSEKGLVTGRVSGVTFEEGQPRLIVNGKNYDPALITTIQASTISAGPSTGATPSANS
ncbi:MAG: flagellar basal-body rod modification protein FlgD [Chthoniobacter sp.]|jgi:flagellar basal-body rod modification protein FlgD|nr:flagellar basal-body rod modification protein FlgD [Chthoniobacter sp.]